MGTINRVYSAQYTINNDLRTVNIPYEKSVVGVEGDKNINIINFLVCRYYNGIDLSDFAIRINYVNANGDPNYFIVEDKQCTDGILSFNWTLTADAVRYNGNLAFNIQIYRMDQNVIEYEFNTTICYFRVLKGLNVEEYIKPEDIEKLIDRLKEELHEGIDDLLAIADQHIEEKTQEAIIEVEQSVMDVIHMDTTANWNAQLDLIGKKGHLYVYTDYDSVNGRLIPGLKVGDGLSYLIDNSFIDSNVSTVLDHINDMDVHITPEERTFWNNKVTCFISKGNSETIVFTKGREE